MHFGKLATAVLSTFVVLSFASQSQAQKQKNPFASNIIGTLSNPKMAGELELLDEQQESIKELMGEFGQLRKNIGQDMKSQWEAASDEERKDLGKEYWRRVEEGRLEIVKEMKANLLPHQIDRLEQLSAQRMLQEGKGRESAGLLSNQMIDYLEISDSQKQKIEEKSQRLKKEVGEKIRKILEEAKQDLLSELNASQKKKYEELIGEPVADDRERGEEKRDRKRRR